MNGWIRFLPQENQIFTFHTWRSFPSSVDHGPVGWDSPPKKCLEGVVFLGGKKITCWESHNPTKGVQFGCALLGIWSDYVPSLFGKYDSKKFNLKLPIHRPFSTRLASFCPAWCLVDGSCGLPRTFDSRLQMSEALSPSVCEELIRRADQEVHGLDKNTLPMVMGKCWCHSGLQYGFTWSLLIQHLFSLNDRFKRTGRSVENVSVFSTPAKTYPNWKCQYLTTNMDVSESTEAEKTIISFYHPS